MDDSIAEVIDALTRSRSLPWFRVLADADLEGPAEPEPDPAAVVAPYRWFIERVGDGITLTQAGHLPPVIVEETMAALGLAEHWYGKGNREVHTYPVRSLRESAQRFGLVRKHKGRLVTTTAGRSLAEDPDALWWHIAAALPDAKTEPQRHAGIAYLLQVAAGRSSDRRMVASALAVLGWVDRETRAPIDQWAAFSITRDTADVFERLGLIPEDLRAPEPPPGPSAVRLARAALLGRPGTAEVDGGADGAPASRAGSAPPSATQGSDRVIQLTVTLGDVTPPVWRRITVPASMTLRRLHGVLQVAMGWRDAHLHLFEIDRVIYGDLEGAQGVPLGDEGVFTIGEAAAVTGEFRYEYDFGDSWDHQIRIDPGLVAIGPDIPLVLAGERACPPEDCGGPGGYAELLAALADPSHEDHEELLDWLGGPWDPEAFDVEATNQVLELHAASIRRRCD